MNVNHLLNIEDDEEFKNGLQDYLNDHSFDLPLEDYCYRGGYPDVDQVEVNEVLRDGFSIAGSGNVTFSEVMSTGCANVDVSFDKSCSFTF